jgi:hypothetical protein
MVTDGFMSREGSQPRAGSIPAAATNSQTTTRADRRYAKRKRKAARLMRDIEADKYRRLKARRHLSTIFTYFLNL